MAVLLTQLTDERGGRSSSLVCSSVSPLLSSHPTEAAGVLQTSEDPSGFVKLYRGFLQDLLPKLEKGLARGKPVANSKTKLLSSFRIFTFSYFGKLIIAVIVPVIVPDRLKTFTEKTKTEIQNKLSENM